jgi:nucleotide-binding universal stress UspA family protein
MFKTILIPLDGSALGERALPYALQIARAAGARLLLLQAARDLALLTRLEVELGLAVRLEPHLDALRRSGAETTPGAAGSLSSSAIARVVREEDVDLIAMSIQGAVADEVLRQTPVPVLLVPAACHRQWQVDRPLRLMVPLDGSPDVEGVLASARDLAETVSTELLLVRAVRTSTPDP